MIEPFSKHTRLIAHKVNLIFFSLNNYCFFSFSTKIAFWKSHEGKSLLSPHRWDVFSARLEMVCIEDDYVIPRRRSYVAVRATISNIRCANTISGPRTRTCRPSKHSLSKELVRSTYDRLSVRSALPGSMGTFFCPRGLESINDTMPRSLHNLWIG
jgi:hypothetical protein